MPDLVREYVTGKPPVDIPDDLAPPTIYPRTPDPSRAAEYAEAERVGLQLLKDGKVAAFLVAGGQGSRLGYDGPKGEYPVTPVRNKPLFQVFAEQLLAWSGEAGRAIPWYVMTSEVNDAATRAVLRGARLTSATHAADVMFFAQGMMPAFGTDGRPCCWPTRTRWPSRRTATAGACGRSTGPARWPT